MKLATVERWKTWNVMEASSSNEGIKEWRNEWWIEWLDERMPEWINEWRKESMTECMKEWINEGTNYETMTHDGMKEWMQEWDIWYLLIHEWVKKLRNEWTNQSEWMNNLQLQTRLCCRNITHTLLGATVPMHFANPHSWSVATNRPRFAQRQ